MPFKAGFGCARMRDNQQKNGTKKLEKSSKMPLKREFGRAKKRENETKNGEKCHNLLSKQGKRKLCVYGWMDCRSSKSAIVIKTPWGGGFEKSNVI